MTTAHLAAMGVWAGGLVTVSVLLLPVPDTAAGVAVTRFSRLALGAVTVLVATGLFQAVRELGGFSALVRTGYGHWLIVTACLVIDVLAVAARSRRAVRLGTRLRRTVLLEIVGLVVVLAVTTSLIGTAPPGQRSTPSLAPRTKYRWNTMNTIATGIVAINAADSFSGYCVPAPNEPLTRSARPRGSV